MNEPKGGERSRLAIVMPVYNEGSTAVEQVAKLLVLKAGHPEWEVIVVDDGSDGPTAAALKAYDGRLRLIRHASNRGYGAALKSGILSTRATDVLFIDSDGQHDPDQIPRLVEALDRYECVFGERPAGAATSSLRKPGKWLLAMVCRFLAARRIPDINSGFRAGRRHIFMRMLELLPDGFSFSITSLLYVMKSRFSFVFVPVSCRPRQGKSTVRAVEDGTRAFLLALRLIMLFDPMRVFCLPSVLLLLVGVLYQVFIFAKNGPHIEGGAILAILAGIVLFHFGLLGDQVSSLRKEISSHTSLMLEDGGASGDNR